MTAGGEGFGLQRACGDPGRVLRYFASYVPGRRSLTPLGVFLEEELQNRNNLLALPVSLD